MSGSSSRPESGGEDADGPEQQTGPGPIFICDASAEAERLITGLRNRGYQTVDVPLGMLPSRVRYEVPILVVCDADAHEALRRIREMREEAPDAHIRLLFVGHDDGALKTEAEFKKRATETLTRPLNLTATLQLIEGLVGPPSRGSSRPSRPQRRLRAPVVVASARKPYRSDSSLPSSRPPVDLDEPAWPTSIPPSMGPVLNESSSEPSARNSLIPGTGSLSSVPPSSGREALSSETRALLQEGKRRVAAQPAQPHRPTRLRSEPEAQDVSTELLEALREPLEPSDFSEPEERRESPTQSRYDSLAASPNVLGTQRFSGQPEAEPSTQEPSAQSQQVAVPEAAGAEPSAQGPSPPASAAQGDEEQTNPGGRPPSAPPDDIDEEASHSPPLERDEPLGSGGFPDSVTGVQTPRPPGSSLPAPTAAQSQRTVPPGDRREASIPTTAQTLNPTDPHHSLPVPQPPSANSLDELSDLLSPQDAPGASLPLVHNTPAPPARRGGERENSAEPAPGTESHPATDAAADSRWPRAVALVTVGKAIRERRSGSLAQQAGQGVRRMILRDGDVLTVTSSAEEETLVAFLVHKGDLGQAEADELGPLPRFGRHAGAALIAHGHLRQDDLWPVLRSHAEWILSRLMLSAGELQLEENVPPRISEEPAVFGGAAGAEIFLDVLKRTVTADMAYRALGAGKRQMSLGNNQALLGEAALGAQMEQRVFEAVERPLEQVRETDPDLLVVLLGLTLLGVLSIGGGAGRPSMRANDVAKKSGQMDDEAFAKRVLARRALVDEGDYFTILGVGRGATSYEIERAWESLRREFSPDRLGPRHVHLHDDLTLVREVIDEARLILRDETRRTRYRTALEATD